MGMEFGIEKYAMLIMKIGREENKAAKSRKHQNTWIEGKLEVHGNIGGKIYQNVLKEKMRKGALQMKN